MLGAVPTVAYCHCNIPRKDDRVLPAHPQNKRDPIFLRIFFRLRQKLWTQGTPNSTNRRRIPQHVLWPPPAVCFKAYLLCRDSPPLPETSPPSIEIIEKQLFPPPKKKNNSQDISEPISLILMHVHLCPCMSVYFCSFTKVVCCLFTCICSLTHFYPVVFIQLGSLIACSFSFIFVHRFFMFIHVR